MLNSQEKQRYNRHLIMPEIGETGQEKLKNARVLVIGAGGLGCPALQYLAAAGVGTLGIVDFDVVDVSNLQRQILYSIDQVGKSKAECAALAVNRINPLVQVIPHTVQLTNQNALAILSHYDLVMDGSDNFTTRYMVNDACFLLKKPLIFGAIHKFEGQVTVFHLKENSPSYRSLFPESPKPGTTANCSETGVLGVLPGIVGSMQAAEVLKIITGIGEPLDGMVVCYDAMDQSILRIEISNDAEQLLHLQPSMLEFESYDYHFGCAVPEEGRIKTISGLELRNDPTRFRIIDIRELHELPKLSEFLVEFWPLSNQNERPISLDNRPTLIFCQKGLRSKNLIKKLLESNPELDLYNLEGGVEGVMRFN
jgi:adenylyltransferase/sulfurtransferase